MAIFRNRDFFRSLLKASGSALGVLWGFAGAVQPAGYSIETGRTRR